MTAWPVADSLMEGLKKVPGLKNLTPAGSLRRFRDTIGDIDLMGTADNPAEVIQAFTTLPQVREVLEKGTTKASVIVIGGLPGQISGWWTMIPLVQRSSTLPAASSIISTCRKRAERMGLSLSEYGITDMATGKLEKFATEEAFYQRQGLDYIPPEIREGQHEIELAEKDALPSCLK